jgi:hypothetical protein
MVKKRKSDFTRRLVCRASSKMNGKGSAPRNCFSPDFRQNYDGIQWRKRERRSRRGGIVSRPKGWTGKHISEF